MGNARDERGERLAVMRLPRSRERTHRAAMKAAQRGDNPGAASSETRKFERAFNSFGTAVAEEDVREPFRRKACKAFQEASTHVVVDNFWTCDEALRLCRDGSGNLWPSMPNIRYAIARRAVDILAPLSVP